MDTLDKAVDELARSKLRKPLADLFRRKFLAHGIRLPKKRINGLTTETVSSKSSEKPAKCARASRDRTHSEVR
jgi:hypothetical protein